MAVTTNLLLTHLTSGQSQKEITVNTNMDYLDTAIAGFLPLSVAGSGSVTLTETQARNFTFLFTGILTGNKTVVVPTRLRTFCVFNGTTGLFTLTIKTLAGTGVTVDQGYGALLLADGTNVWRLLQGNPGYTPVIASVAGSGAPLALQAWQTGALITNQGAAALNYNLLPAAQAGLTFTFMVQDADGMRIVAQAGDTIRIAPGSVSSTGGYAESTGVGDRLQLCAINDTEWVILAGGAGSWSVA